MVIKEQIMLTAFDLFSEHGIKNVSMDDIAHNASISKRTLYELFEDKETLLTECINLSYTKMRLSMKRLESEPITALEVALLFYEASNPQLSSSASFLRLNVLSSLN